MKYCRFCGYGLEDNDFYCSKCGKRTEGYSYEAPRTPEVKKEPKEKLFCELAYTGFLFWLPLAFCKGERHAKQSANQGLWTLIAAIVCCTAIRMFGALNSLFSGTLFGAVTSGVYGLMFIVFLSFMLFLTIKCLKNAFQIHKGSELEPILFFDKAAIIR